MRYSEAKYYLSKEEKNKIKSRHGHGYFDWSWGILYIDEVSQEISFEYYDKKKKGEIFNADELIRYELYEEDKWKRTLLDNVVLLVDAFDTKASMADHMLLDRMMIHKKVKYTIKMYFKDCEREYTTNEVKFIQRILTSLERMGKK